MITHKTRGEMKYVYYLLICSFIYSMFFFTLNILKYKSFFSFEWEDDAAENQVIYNIAHSFYPHQTIFLSKYFFGHFTPIYYLIALFYLIYPHIYTWYFLISFLYGFSSFIVYFCAKDKLRNANMAFLYSMAFLIYPPLHFVNLGALDGILFALPLLFIFLYSIEKKIYWLFLTSGLLCLLCKEDVSLIMIAVSFFLFYRKYEFKWWGVLFIIAILYFVFAIYFVNVISHLAGFESDIKNNSFVFLDIVTIKGIVNFFISKPIEAAKFVFMWKKARLFIFMFAPLLFIPVFSVYSILPWTAYAEILLSKYIAGNDSYYIAPLIPFLFIGGIGVLKKVEGRNAIFSEWLLIFILLVEFFMNFSMNIPGWLAKDRIENISDRRFLGVTNIFDKKFYHVDNKDKEIWKALKLIPKNASVSATGSLLPALSMRQKLYEIGLNLPESNYLYSLYNKYPVYESQYIIFVKKHLFNGMGGIYPCLNRKQMEFEIKKIKTRYHYKVLLDTENVIVLRKCKI